MANLLKKATGFIGDVGTNLYKGAENILNKGYEYTIEKTNIERLAKRTGKGLENIAQETGKGLESAGQEVGRFGEKAGHELSNAWTEGGLREAVMAAGLTAAVVATGGAAAGLSAGAIGGLAGTAGALSGYKAQRAVRAEVKQERAQAEYQKLVDKANAEALEERKSSLLKTKKQLMPNLAKSYQGGVSGVAEEESSIKLG